MNEPKKINTPPQIVGVTIEARLGSATAIIGGLFNEIKGAADAPVAAPQPTGESPMERLESAEAIIGDLFAMKSRMTQQNPPASNAQGGGDPKPLDLPLSQSPTDGTQVIRLKNATITRYPTGKSNSAKPPALDEGSLTKEWSALKVRENAGEVAAGTSLAYWRENQAGIRKERLRARNPDAHIVS